ncbi:A-type flagellin [Andreesenia angusta]|uniref:Flagellin n=1 Tax=Andreesenia angusta TaxID=39480 RepID=A0A1S1V6G7_9FIRM|nr:flagellin [Andreesenia angusta]OHW61970.1 A-type flagellin [Andreesenia angusta]
MRINNNMLAMNTHRQMGITGTNQSKSMEKLSSGQRINRAGDDAAGLAISEKMRGQIRGLNMASKNAQDGISMIQTAEGALNETQAILQRMRELAVQSANDTNVSVDRTEIQKEMNQLADEIDRIGNTTEFNTQKLLNGDKVGLKDKINGAATLDLNTAANVTANALSATSLNNISEEGTIVITRTRSTAGATAATLMGDFTIGDPNGMSLTGSGNGGVIGIKGIGTASGLALNNMSGMKVGDSITIKVTKMQAAKTDATKALAFQIGANSGQSMLVGIEDMRASSLGVRNGTAAVDVSTYQKATAAVTSVNTAIERVSAQRSQLGAFQNRLEHSIKNLDTSAENLQASESRIRDVDMAKEMMNLTKQNILQQASQAMMAQANSAPQGVLQLLR